MNIIQNQFTLIEQSVKEYYDSIKQDNINLKPIGQRNAVQASSIGGVEPSKAQSILNSMFMGLDIGEVSLAHSDESLDGGHRSRTIIGFIENRIPLHKTSRLGEKYFTQLSKEYKDYFLNYRLRVTDFFELENGMVGKQFIQFNTQTDPNFYEKMNSYGYEKSIVDLREKAQVCDYTIDPKVEGYEGLVDNVYPYFKEYISYKNNRMLFYGQIIESAALHFHKSISVSESDVQDYINSATSKQIATVAKGIEEEYRFYEHIGMFWKTYNAKKITIKDFHILRSVYWLVKEINGKVEDYDRFVMNLTLNLNDFHEKNAQELYVDDNGDYLDSKYTIVSKAFDSYIKKVSSERKLTQAREWLRPLLPNVIERDTIRAFPKEMLLKRWNKVGKSCEISGDSISFDQVEGAHLIPYKDGGRTVYKNLMVTSEFHNSRMGTTNALEYKKTFLAENS